MGESFQTLGLNMVGMAEIAIDQIDPFDGDAWDALIATRGDHSIFHRSAWARVLTESYGHQPYYLRISINNAEAALVPLMAVRSCLTGFRGVSLPFSDFAGALWTEPKQTVLVYQTLIKFASEQKWKHLEIRGAIVPPADSRPFLSYESHNLDLRQGIELIERRLDGSVRRAIRKALRSGLEVTVERSMEAMDAFYDLHGRTRRRHGLPPQPISFFNAIANNLVRRGFGEIVLARLAGTPVAGAVFLRSGGRAVYKFGASDSAHWQLRSNNLVMWTAICHLVESGCSELHFGRTSKADKGLVRFKLSWGSVSHELPYYRFGSRSKTWQTANRLPEESHLMIFGHLPVGLNRLAGRLIYPHLD